MYFELQKKDVERIIDIISQDDELRIRFLEALQHKPSESNPTSGRRLKIRIDEFYESMPFSVFCEEKGISIRTSRAIFYYLVMHDHKTMNPCTVRDVLDSFEESTTIYLEKYFRSIRGIGDKGIRELMKAFGEITLN
ncbi:MAG: hypothetical protein IKM73_00455 [Acidaminococcaceae bacterium]|nr:hypothetical protein [Acidaminococcaceae bacterium]